jgi:prevent-host-death family protein
MAQVGAPEIGAFEAKNKLGTLLDRVQQGEEIVITRHGRPVARLVPNAGGIDRAQAQAAFDRIRVRAALVKGGPYDWETLKADRDAGRPGMDQ